MKRWWPWALLAVAILLIALLARSGDDSGTPLDPRSAGPLGAKGLVDLLDEMGAEVTIGPRATGDVAVVLVDELGKRQERRLQEWVDDGGVLVVADPMSPLVPALARTGGGLFEGDVDQSLRPDCALPALAQVETIEVPDAAGFRVKPGAVGCFPVGGAAYLVARRQGEGTVIALGGGAPFINDRLDDADNAVLAVSLMAPRPGASVVILEADAPGSGDDSVFSLVPRGVRTGIWQLGIAFVALALWRGRRVGKPVEETQPVDIPGSELVVATGNLLQHARRREAAADMLRFQLRRELSARFALRADAPVDHLVTVLTDRGVDALRVDAALSPRPLADDAELVRLATAIDSLRREVMHV